MLNEPDDPMVYRSPLEEGKYEKALENEGELKVLDFIKNCDMDKNEGIHAFVDAMKNKYCSIEKKKPVARKTMVIPKASLKELKVLRGI